MSILNIPSNNTFNTRITVRESDKYSLNAYVKFDRSYIPEGIEGCNEMFFTVAQLEELGKFFIAQAEEIRVAQDSRHSESTL